MARNYKCGKPGKRGAQNSIARLLNLTVFVKLAIINSKIIRSASLKPNLETKEILAQGLTMMATAFTFVAALAWNEAIKKLVEEFVPKGQGVASLFIYAILVTAIAIFFSIRILKLKERLENQVIGE